MNRRFWQGKRVFITGHTGFKGTWLCAWLLEAGAHVSGFALEADSSSPFGASRIADDMDSIVADVRDDKALAGAVAASSPDIVLHLAAQSLVRRSFEAPAETFAVNAVGTANLLDAMRSSNSARAIIVVTSDKCYAPGDPSRRHAEDDALGGDDPYSASKACAELVAASYRLAFDEDRIATARAGNVIGGGDGAAHRLLPDMLRAFDAGSSALIRRPDDVRPWQHVLDPLAGYLRLAEALYGDPRRYAEAWNFGPGPDHEVAVRHVADAVAATWGPSASWTVDRAFNPLERPSLRLDSAKAAQHLGWQGRIGLDDAVRWTVEWHKARGKGESVRDLLLRDIARFEGIAS